MLLNSRAAFSTFILVLVVLIWCLQLFNSLWIDELQTYWVVADSFLNVSVRSLMTQGFSPLYFILLKTWTELFGYSELALRLPSVIFACLSAMYVYLIAKHIFDKQTACLSVVFFIVTDEVISAAGFARPYAMALLFATASVYYLLVFLETNRFTSRALYILSSVLCFYAHYLFIYVFIIQLAVVFSLTGRRHITWVQLFVNFFAIVVACLPALAHIQILAQRSGHMKASGAPGIAEYALAASAPLSVSFFVLPLLILWLVFNTKPNLKYFSKEIFSKSNHWLVIWFFGPALALWSLSLVTNKNFLLPRYYLCFAPALAIIVGRLYFSLSKYKTVALTIVVLMVLLFEPLKFRNMENWRDAVAALNKQLSQQERVVLLFSSMRQSHALLEADNKSYEMFFAPTDYYRLQQQPMLIPNGIQTVKGDLYWDEKLLPTLPEADQVSLLVFNNIMWKANSGTVEIVQFLSDKLANAGYTLLEQQQFKRVLLLDFESNSSSKE